MNRGLMLAHADTHVSNLTVFRNDRSALCEVQMTTQAAVGGICLPSMSRKFAARNNSTSFQSSLLSGRYKHTYISSNLLPRMGMFLGVLPTQPGDFEMANIITQPGSNLLGCGADETLAETLIC